MLLNPGNQRALAAATRATTAGAVDQEELYRPTLDQCGELGCRQDGVAAGEAAQCDDRLIGRQDNGVRLVRADDGNQVLRTALVRFQVRDECRIHTAAAARSQASAGLPARPGDREACRLARQYGDR